MTVSEMVLEVYNQLGRPSYLRPLALDGETVDMGSEGATTILQWLNRGYRRILTWRFPNGRIVRFRNMERKLYFSSTVITGALGAAAAQSATLDASAAAVLSRYVGWTLEVGGEKKKIMAYTAGRIATLNTAWSSTPAAGTAYSLYKNFSYYRASTAADVAEHIDVNPVNSIMSVVRVTDMTTGTALTRADRTANFEGALVSSGVPGVFQDREDGLFFDVAIDETRYYELRYNGFPAVLSAGTDEPAMPPQFHEAVLLWSIWWGLRMLQEFSGAYSTKKDLEDVMNTALQQYDLSNDREDIGLYMEDRYGVL